MTISQWDVTGKRRVSVDRDDTLGKRLAKARKKARLSQQAVADAVLEPSQDGSYRKNTIYEWEKDIYVPSALALEKLARLYSVSADYLLGLPEGDDALRLQVIGRVVDGEVDAETLRSLATSDAATEAGQHLVDANNLAGRRKPKAQNG